MKLKIKQLNNFSIRLKSVQFKVKSMDLKKQIRIALGIDTPEAEIKLEFQAKLEDGTIIVSEADELSAGVSIMVLAEDGTTMPLPVGSYTTAEGVSFTVEEEGIVAEVLEAEQAEDEEDDLKKDEEYMSEEQEITEEVAEVEFDKEGLINEIGAVVKELLSEVKSDLERLDAELKEMKGENTNLKEENKNLDAKVQELSKEPATKPVNTNKFSNNTVRLSKADYSQLSKKEKFLYNLNINK
jgi:hypothetical protein